MPLSTSQTVHPLHIISKLMLNFSPILPQDIICVFDYISLFKLFFTPYSPEIRSFIKTPFPISLLA